MPIVIQAHASDGQLKVSVVTKYVVLLQKAADFVKGSIEIFNPCIRVATVEEFQALFEHITLQKTFQSRFY